ncbi:hypothetical protein [Martelella mangrovi]|uniref:DUF2188 domain-containing protein n=1 Tax=Martelella mangrovi TaxID=1397477 RepID=A0ABV2IHS7_9HYPH
MTRSTDISDFQPRAECRLVCVGGWSFCRCGWSDHPGGKYPCRAALEDAQDAAIREAIEGAEDWRPAERLQRGGAPARFGSAMTTERQR